MVVKKHPGIILLPILVACGIVALASMWALGVDLPWLQLTMFVGAVLLLAFGFIDMLVRDVRRSHLHPITLRAGVLAVMVAETLLLFASAYLLIADRPDQMMGLTTPLDAVYFTMTTLMTIGFGDISAQGQLARAVVLTQMFFSVIVLTASVRLLSSLIRSFTKEVGHHDGGDAT